VNQAVKALAIARGYLDNEKDRVDVSCYPEFRNEEKEAVSFVLTKSILRKKPTIDEGSELRVAASSEPTVVAGSIAGKVRSGDRVSVVCLGAASVNQTIKSIIIARRYLARDAIDICFRPEFVHLNMQGEERSALRFVVLAMQI